MGFLGSSALSDIKFGSSAVSKVYRGSSPLWQPPVAGSFFGLTSYSGDASARSITGIGFEPGMVWINNQFGSATYDPCIFDQLRGTGRFIASNVIGREYVDANTLTSFDADGFSLGTSGTTNSSIRTFDAFCWAKGNTDTNTNGTITTTTHTNLAAGYSMFTYNGNQTANATIGHGLDSAPEWVYIQSRTNGFTKAGQCHSSLLSGSFPTGIRWPINDTGAATASTQYIRVVGSSTITLSSDSNVNGPAANGFIYVGYAFKSIPGVSKLGLATGDGSGVLSIDCGFSPRLLIMKSYIGTGAWLLHRRTNDTIGYATVDSLSTSAASTLSTEVQITANGFSIDAEGYGNVTGSTSSIWYMAYA